MTHEFEKFGLSHTVMMNLLRGTITTAPIVDAILDSIKPHWPGSYLKAIEVQGNWPTNAEWGVCLVTNNRGFYNKENQSNHFFTSKEEMDKWFLTVAHDPEDFAVKAYVYEWDLGPQYKLMVQIS